MLHDLLLLHAPLDALGVVMSGPGRDEKKRPTRGMRPLGRDELANALSDHPPILTLQEAAQLLRISPSTLYHQVSRGEHRDAVKRGKPLRFWRDRLVRSHFRTGKKR